MLRCYDIVPFSMEIVPDDVDRTAFFDIIKKLIANPAPLLPYNSPYTKSEMNRRILNLINK